MLARSILRPRACISPQSCSNISPSKPLSSRPSGSVPVRRQHQFQRNFSSTPPVARQNSRWRRTTVIGLPAASAIGLLVYSYSTTSAPIEPINPASFTPFVVSSKKSLSSNSAIITLLPKYPSSKTPSNFWSSIWESGIWSIQVKQPQLQIQREYTPLPPNPELSAKDGEIRLFVRSVPNGEVSGFLMRKKIGEDVEIRGPVVSYPWETAGRNPKKNKIRNVVFLAGGTGVSPAVQTAYHLMSQQDGGSGKQLTILFASRSSSEEALPDLKALHESIGNLKVVVKCFYDDMGTFITPKEVEAAVAGLSSRGEGRDVIMVSGPEGFINHFSGKKGWKDGFGTQGVVGGVVGDILRRRKESIEVLKL